jgi:hypothetical protein
MDSSVRRTDLNTVSLVSEMQLAVSIGIIIEIFVK